MAAKFISERDLVEIKSISEEEFLTSVEKCVRDYLLTGLPEGEVEIAEGFGKIKESPVQTLIGVNMTITIKYNQTLSLIGEKLSALLSNGVDVSMRRVGTSRESFSILLIVGIGDGVSENEVVRRRVNHAAINMGGITGIPHLMSRGIFPVIDGNVSKVNWVKYPEEFRSITAELDWVE